ncbi:hypothetical protein GCM10009647_056980 [Streptomyces sanglieri]
MTEANDDLGVIYLAFGYEYAVQAIQSVCSLKSIHPELDASILTNVPLKEEISDSISYKGTVVGPKLFDNVIYVNDSNDSNRDYKTTINEYSPYDKTLFLDCDIIIKSRIKDGFKILDYADIAALYRPLPSGPMVNSWGGKINVEGLDIEHISSFYSGVIFFNKRDSKEFFERWNKKYQEFGYKFDQYAFTHSIITSNIHYLPLPATWNAMDNHMKPYNRFDSEYNFKSNIKIRHKNYYTISRMNELRKFEKKIGQQFLDINTSHKKMKVRKEFIRKFGVASMAKSLLGKSRILSSLYKAYKN